MALIGALKKTGIISLAVDGVIFLSKLRLFLFSGGWAQKEAHVK
jgi:hypothetical protein